MTCRRFAALLLHAGLLMFLPVLTEVCFFAGKGWTGATGLERATSGVTGVIPERLKGRSSPLFEPFLSARPAGTGRRLTLLFTRVYGGLRRGFWACA
jgi:hypothetical protein